jgi:hypothetical protein
VGRSRLYFCGYFRFPLKKALSFWVVLALSSVSLALLEKHKNTSPGDEQLDIAKTYSVRDFYYAGWMCLTLRLRVAL